MKGELLWFLSGSSDVKELQKLGCHIWDANAEADYWKPKAKFEGDLGRVYGVQWRNWKSAYSDVPIDQISNVIKKLKENPTDRRMIVSAWSLIIKKWELRKKNGRIGSWRFCRLDTKKIRNDISLPKLRTNTTCLEGWPIKFGKMRIRT